MPSLQSVNVMTKLPKSLAAWNSLTFKSVIKQELLDLKPGSLPLEKGTSQGGYVDEKNLGATILGTSETTQTIIITAGMFFTEIVICCGCGDDPMPTNAYCELEICIDKNNANTVFNVI